MLYPLDYLTDRKIPFTHAIAYAPLAGFGYEWWVERLKVFGSKRISCMDSIGCFDK